MKLIQQLLEMAKGKTKRKKQSKLRRLKKSVKPTQDAAGNPVASALADLKGAGQGAHPTTKDKEKSSRGRRKAERKEIKKEMDY